MKDCDKSKRVDLDQEHGLRTFGILGGLGDRL